MDWMDWERRIKLMLRWSILTASLIALFWTIYYFATGSVPVATSINMTFDSTFVLPLPFAISHWWDILLGPIFSCIFVLLFTVEKREKDDDLATSLAYALVFGLRTGLVVGLIYGLIISLGTGLVFGLVAGLATGLAAVLLCGLCHLIDFISTKTRKFRETASDWLKGL